MEACDREKYRADTTMRKLARWGVKEKMMAARWTWTMTITCLSSDLGASKVLSYSRDKEQPIRHCAISSATHVAFATSNRSSIHNLYFIVAPLCAHTHTLETTMTLYSLLLLEQKKILRPALFNGIISRYIGSCWSLLADFFIFPIH